MFNQMCLVYPLADQSPGFAILTRLGEEWNRLRVAWYTLVLQQKVEPSYPGASSLSICWVRLSAQQSHTPSVIGSRKCM